MIEILRKEYGKILISDGEIKEWIETDGYEIPEVILQNFLENIKRATKIATFKKEIEKLEEENNKTHFLVSGFLGGQTNNECIYSWDEVEFGRVVRHYITPDGKHKKIQSYMGEKELEEKYEEWLDD